MIRIEMTEEQFEKLVDILVFNDICPSGIGLPHGCRALICRERLRATLKPETIPDKGKEG